MGKIIQLDEQISNMIAAGEVVENMASVIKELLENSIDANATDIKIALKDSGLKMIKVEDNGDGMDESDIKMAFKRHATSKIKTHHDLHHIGSLGFRGEALPSIASVAKVTLESSLNKAPGHQAIIENGHLKGIHKGRALKGTSIIVENLFYNTPARLKHLKSEQRELALLLDYVNKLALSHPYIAFELSNNQKILLKTKGDGNHLKILNSIYALEIIKNMVPFENANQYFKIRGYLTKPAYNRSSNQHMHIITNKRIIKNKRLIHAIKAGYDTYLPMHKSPIIFLEVEVDPIMLDVNIHPQKLEVKFSEQHSLEHLITSTINDRLRQENLIPKTYKTPKLKNQTQETQTAFDMRDQENQTQKVSNESPHKDVTSPQDSNDETHPYDSDIKTYTDEFTPPKTVRETPPDTVKNIPRTDRLPYLEYIGQYSGTYLLFQNENGLYIIDQHAAAERIRYENYLDKMSNPTSSTQRLLTPIELYLSNNEVQAYETYKPQLEYFGLKTKQHDSNTLHITSIPTWFKKNLETDYAESMIKYLLNDTTLSIDKIINQLAKDLSCKHSIRANKHINHGEVDVLIKDLNRVKNPFTCPHGRPTIIEISLNELETRFKRVQ